MFHSMIQTVLGRLPGGVSLPVQYPAGPSQNTTSGEKFVVDTINREHRKCPAQKYALFGYSQGATVMLRALSQLDEEIIGAVKSVILVGNPYRLPGKASNVNGTSQPGNDDTVGMFVNSTIANNETVPQLSSELDQSGKVLDYCLEDDTVCALNPVCKCQISIGHLLYGSVASIQDTAIEHVVARLNGSQDNV
ncbi:hypothetical protein diail_11229 [Diaporthe ilicicola]|nr:hypothetical protein diail_11229 [Diaporthe ilicicola]